MPSAGVRSLRYRRWTLVAVDVGPELAERRRMQPLTLPAEQSRDYRGRNTGYLGKACGRPTGLGEHGLDVVLDVHGPKNTKRKVCGQAKLPQGCCQFVCPQCNL